MTGVLLTLSWSCSSNDDVNNEYTGEGLKLTGVQHAQKAMLPDCLVHFVDSLEDIKATTGALGTGVVCQMTYDGKTGYAVYAPFSSVKNIQFLDADGNAIPMESKEAYDRFAKEEVSMWQYLYTIRDEETVRYAGSDLEVPYVPEASNNYPKHFQECLQGLLPQMPHTILRGTLNGETVYQMYSVYSSNNFGNTYDADGNIIDVWNKGGMTSGDVIQTVTDWKCIFHISMDEFMELTRGI